MADFSDDHLGKRVVTQSGREIGNVVEVRNGDLYVSIETDSLDETVDELGWEGPVEQDRHRLEDRYISTVTENAIRLRV